MEMIQMTKKLQEEDWKVVTVPGKTKIETCVLAEYIIERLPCFTTTETREVFVYTDGVYKEGSWQIEAQTQKLIGDETRNRHVNEVLAAIKRATFVDAKNVDTDKQYLNLENGLYDFKQMQLYKHDPKYLETVRIPIRYNPSAECPKVMKFLNEIVAAEDIPLLQEFTGYCLYKGYPIQKAFLLVGAGANGKSTFLNLLKAFVGSDNTASVDIEKLDKDLFSAAQLQGKLVNIQSELPNKSITTKMFTKLTGEDTIYAQHKFQSPFGFTNFSKMIFAANKIPKLPDDTDAYIRRWELINFPNQFEGDQANVNLLNQLTTKNELSGMLNWAIEGLRRLLQHNRFSQGKSIEEARENYIKMAQPSRAFIDTALESGNGEIKKDKLYDIFTTYCRKNNLPACSKGAFAHDIKKAFPFLRETRRGRRGEAPVPCWNGITIKVTEQTVLGEAK